MPISTSSSRNIGLKRYVNHWKGLTAATRSKSRQIKKAEAKLREIAKRQRFGVKRVNFQLPIFNIIIAPTGVFFGPSYGHNALVIPKSWKDVFFTETSVGKGSRFDGKSLNVEYRLSTVDGTDPVSYSVFIVKVKKELAAEFARETNRGVTLRENIHYTLGRLGVIQMSAMVQLNTEIFDILYVKKGMFGPTVEVGIPGVPDPPEPLPPIPPVVYTETTKIDDNQVQGRTNLNYNASILALGDKKFKDLTVEDVNEKDQIHMYVFANSHSEQVTEVHANVMISGEMHA